ncbi:hypothetical protein O3M35_001707 [Rhynocoris fuscipes]|uniref:Kinesin-like protein n=1 Tax=Rhynocoris fuscipes TaxID=488301 RepID=A0AAW1CS75_9HEMI
MALGKRDFNTAFKSENAISSTSSKSIKLKINNQNHQKDNDKSKVKVFIRVRPFNEREQSCGCSKILNIVDKTSLVFDPKVSNEPFFYQGTVQKGRDMTKKVNKDMLFEFDQVFGEDSTNDEVYEATTKNMVPSLFDGYNCSVFAYGATGAGKTFTMLGTQTKPGITYLTIVELMRQIEASKESLNVSIGVSYLEVYNEVVKDLLHPSSPQLQLREEGGRVVVSGLKVEKIHSSEQLFSLLEEGNRNRSQHPTDSNAESSRSHAVFQVHVRMDNKGQVKIAKLSMIDLAGSERGSATGCKGTRFKEGSNINKSLLALGNCINSLADGLKHVPYRDSKLTRILKDSLGGNCLTVMIANISPSSLSFEDSYNTLKYASRAKCIKTKVTKNVVNETRSVAYYKKQVEELQEKISKLEKNVLPDTSNWDQRIREIMEQKKALHRDMLKLRSQEKLTEWRLEHKTAAQSLYDSAGDSQSLSRLNSCITQLKARVEGIRSRIDELKPRQEANHELAKKLLADIKNQGPLSIWLQEKVDFHQQQINNEEQAQCIDHMNTILRLQAKQEEKHTVAIETVMPVLNECFSLLRGHGYVTNDLDSKYEEAMKRLDGIKNVTWCDDDDEVPKNNQYLRLSLSILNPSSSSLAMEEDGKSSQSRVAIKKPSPLQPSLPKRLNLRSDSGSAAPLIKSKTFVKSKPPTQENVTSGVNRVKTPCRSNPFL